MSRALPSERVAVVATVDPIDATGASLKTDAVDLGVFDSAMFVLQLGVLNASSTITSIALQESATTSDGDFAAMSPAKSATSTDGSDDGKQIVMNVRSEELSAGKRYVRMVATVSAHSALVAILGLGFDPRYAPASDNDLSSVDEIVE